MKLKNLHGSSRAVTLCAALALLAGCRSSALPPDQGAQAPQTNAAETTTVSEKVLFRFKGGDGAAPTSGLTELGTTVPLNAHGGPFYGTTGTGGIANAGTVYQITSRGDQRVLHDFKSGKHSYSPAAELTSLNGKLYGTAYGDQPCKPHNVGSCGAIFEIDSSGKERLVYVFKGGTDAAQPVGALTVLNGVLYGTTLSGGKFGLGTVFRVTTSGDEKVIHSFVKPEGLQPTGSLIVMDGKLYGTTFYGGKYSFGTAFSVTTAGKETVLHDFAGTPDGANPAGGLSEIGGVLYGDTRNGGAPSPSGYCFYYAGTGCGTIFSLDVSGKEAVIYSFGGPPDGAFPYAALTNVSGTLYGTTVTGGSTICRIRIYCGTVFSIDVKGNEKVLHRFTGPPDGANPYASVIAVKNRLLGTTEAGGSVACGYYYGCGTVFSVAIPSDRSRRR